MTSSRPERRRGLLIDGLLVVLVLLTGAILLQPGVFSVDESHYLLAADAFAQRGSFQIENGYERYHAPELLFFYTVIPDEVDRLGTVSTVPPYHAILAAPYLRLLGLPGLIWLNLICFAATCVAVRRLAARLKPDGPFPVAAAAVFALGSFGLEYALGIWPHALSQALIAWALVAFLCAAESQGRRAWLLAGLSGLLASLATGVRLQNIVMLPILPLMARWALRCPWRQLASHLAGWVPPLLGYSLINLHRLGTPNPFTYGKAASLSRSIPAGLIDWAAGNWWAAFVLAAAVWGLWWLRRRAGPWGLLAGLGALAAAALILVPPLRALSGRWLSMAGFHLLDTACLPAGLADMGSRASELGQSLHGGMLKKGLLETAPFLALSLLVLVAGRRPPANLRFLSGVGLLGALLLPAVLTPGGLGHNPRYLLELLPALAAASLYWGWQLASPRAWLLAGILAGLLLALPVALHPGSVDEPSTGRWEMLAPLLLAGLLLGCAAAAILKADLLRGAARGAAFGLLGAALAYSMLIQLGVDLNRSLTVRYYAKRILEEGRRAVPDRSVLLAWEARKDVFSPLKLDRDVLIGGIGPAGPDPEALVRAAAFDRRVLFLRDGIPPDRWDHWTRPYRTRTEERHGLQFVELLPRGEP